MYASDRLRERRMKQMETPGEGDAGAEPKDEGQPSDRSVKLTDSEMKSLGGTYKPGEEVSCTVTGRIDHEGKLDIIEIAPAGAAPEEKETPPMGGSPMGAPPMPGMMG